MGPDDFCDHTPGGTPEPEAAASENAAGDPAGAPGPSGLPPRPLWPTAPPQPPGTPKRRDGMLADRDGVLTMPFGTPIRQGSRPHLPIVREYRPDMHASGTTGAMRYPYLESSTPAKKARPAREKLPEEREELSSPQLRRCMGFMRVKKKEAKKYKKKKEAWSAEKEIEKKDIEKEEIEKDVQIEKMEKKEPKEPKEPKEAA